MADAESPRGHPAIHGREAELGSVSDALRRLVALAVTSEVPAEILAEVASGLNALGDRLEEGLPAVPFPRFVGRDPALPADGREVESSMPFDVVVGRYNPLALPVRL